jgi:hypothetical protein
MQTSTMILNKTIVYGIRRFNTAFTRPLQLFPIRSESIQLLIMTSISLKKLSFPLRLGLTRFISCTFNYSILPTCPAHPNVLLLLLLLSNSNMFYLKVNFTIKFSLTRTGKLLSLWSAAFRSVTDDPVGKTGHSFRKTR